MKRAIFATAFVIAGVVLLLASTSAQAVVVIDPDLFAAGTDISTAYTGVTLTASGAGVDGRVYSRNDPRASTGIRTFGNSFPTIAGDLWGTNPGILFRADFARLADFVAIDVIPNNGFDPATLSAFDSSGTLLASVTTSGTTGSGIPEVASITRGVADIAYVTVFDPSNNYFLDNLQYNPIPEPTTLTLLGLTLAGAGVLQRRKRG